MKADPIGLQQDPTVVVSRPIMSSTPISSLRELFMELQHDAMRHPTSYNLIHSCLRCQVQYPTLFLLIFLNLLGYICFQDFFIIFHTPTKHFICVLVIRNLGGCVALPSVG